MSSNNFDQGLYEYGVGLDDPFIPDVPVFSKPAKKSYWYVYVIIILFLGFVLVTGLLIYFKTKAAPGCLPDNSSSELGSSDIPPWSLDFPDKTAKWIWNIPNADTNAPVNISLRFQYIYNTSQERDGIMKIACESPAEVYLNRVKMATTSGSRSITEIPLPFLSGNNTIVIVTKNIPKSAGFSYAGLIATVLDSSSHVMFNSNRNWTWTN